MTQILGGQSMYRLPRTARLRTPFYILAIKLNKLPKKMSLRNQQAPRLALASFIGVSMIDSPFADQFYCRVMSIKPVPPSGR